MLSSLGYFRLGLVWFLLPLLLLSSLVSATIHVDIQGSVAWNLACKDIDALHPQTKVVLDGGRFKASVRKNGNFTFFNVSPGSYLLEVLARDHVFDSLRVDVREESSLRQSPEIEESLSSSSFSSSAPHTVTGATTVTTSNDDESSTSQHPPHPYQQVQIRPAPPGTPFHPTDSPHYFALPLLPYPIMLNPRGQKVYFVEEKGFDILEMFKNPMMMMMLLAGAMIFLLPKMLENMDPDLVKDMRERQDKMFNLQNSLQNGDFSALKAELLKPPTQESSSSSTARENSSSSPSGVKKSQTASGKKTGGGGRKKR